ncbi:thiamine-phosphate kinase [uncultured Gordonia sp.]|uniref:thiamine-phosphate kinase n=1 Tax=Gordonia sp. (in: high G+C Gram-positive bacteria) TaxID=84139 RepID=UPI001DECC085|nr:thiamine-phosphate kinase [Gordonia sp. (in: high G+C Gram-positive bacteria)]MCB1295495.1 thiamine-phosphate kinase [Gordonia sp. (in: high G+C Gram-positive bacteria)]HMS75029.1 thiamine-phosphate kinase [Gordonia sp. (in: high G+C Gram-positive bacteria)]
MEPSIPGPITSVTAGRTVGDVGERAVLAELIGAVEQPPDAGDITVVGTGDDAAVFAATGETAISTDTIVEGRHFRLDLSSPRQIGARSVVQSAADVAAMGARVIGVVVSIAVPPSTAVEVVTEINQGIAAAARDLGAAVLGGDLVAARQIVITVTALGAMDGLRPVLIGGARPGDTLAVSGPLGASAAGLAVLLSGRPELRERFAEFVSAFRVPHPDLAQGVVAARAGARAMTDISDGLIEELITVADRSGVQVAVDTSAVPRPAALAVAAAELGLDETDWVLTGGEDHQLLAAFELPGQVPGGWTVVGEVRPRPTGPDGRGVLVDDAPVGAVRGWQSFGPGT